MTDFEYFHFLIVNAFHGENSDDLVSIPVMIGTVGVLSKLVL